ncbi:MAG: transglycosylase SLT domain-containing protein [Methylomonas sp.]|nr:transglycosylase SLT domain-containing protein [Methylomonas sp.]
MMGSLAMLSLPIQSLAANHAEAKVKIIRTSFQSSKLQNTIWWQVGMRHQIDPYLLYAVALVESRKHGKQNQVTPWPWAINNAGKSFVPNSQKEAEILLNKILNEGQRNVDVGIMQVNLHWHGHRVAKPEHLLNPNTNLEIGAALLAEAIKSAPNNLALGVGRYYSWKHTTAAVEYGQQVISLANQIRALI